MKEGETLFVALVLVRARPAQDLRGRLRAPGLDRAPLAALARPRRVPRPPVAHLPPAQRRSRSRACPTRPPARWWPRPPPRCPRRPAASATGTTATPGSATPRSCSGASTRSASTGRPTTSSTSSPTWPRREEGQLQIMYGIGGESQLAGEHARPPVGLRGRPARCGSATAPTTRTSTTSGARSSTPSTSTRSSRDHLPERIWPILVQPGRGGARELARARPRHLGGARRAAALHLVEAHVLGGRRSRRPAGRDPRGAREGGPLAVGRRRDQGGHLRERARRPRRLHPALRHRRPRRLGAADAARALPAAGGRAHPQDGAGHRRRAHRGRPRAPLPGGGDRRRPQRARRARSRSARSGSCRRWSRSASWSGRASSARSCSPTPARWACTPRRSTRPPAATSATSRRRSRTWR